MIRPADPQLSIELESDIAEVGGSCGWHIRRAPVDGASNDATFGSVRAVRVRLVMETEGRGDRDTRRIGEIEAAVDEFGMASHPFRLPVPSDAPISYDGSLMRVLWRIEALSDRKFSIDSKMTADVLIVPVGGIGLYSRPHPLR